MVSTALKSNFRGTQSVEGLSFEDAMMLQGNEVIFAGEMDLLPQRTPCDVILLMIICSTVKPMTDGLFLKAFKAWYHSVPRKIPSLARNVNIIIQAYD